jgi:pSer/pThr/pTyr-binding forkhead associated (FHA) protein
MRKARDEQVDPSKPALIVTYGNTTRKYRPLDRDLLTIGRSPCCDIGLVSPEVAPIHCIIVKSASGWRIRDCTGRSGTHLNGESVNDEPLTDGDTVQVGTFSFQVNLPRIEPSGEGAAQAPVATAVAVVPSQLTGNPLDERKILHLKQSRERLARHALNLRRRLRDKQAAATDPVAPLRFDAELGTQRAELEQREKQLRFWEKELNEEDRRLREEYCEVEHQRKQLEQFAQENPARKQAEFDAKADSLLAERRAELENEAEARLAARRSELEAEAERALSQRRGELFQFAAQLETREQELEENTLNSFAAKQADMAALEVTLQQKQGDLDEQLKQIEAINAALAEERDALRLEYEDAVRSRTATEVELESQVREVEHYVESLRKQCDAHRRQVEQKHGPITAPLDNTTPTRALDIRARELDAYARHLQHTRATLSQYEHELSEAYQQFHAEYDQGVREAQAIKDRAAQEAEALRHRSQHNDPLSDTAHGESLIHDEEATAAVLEQLRQENDQKCADLTTQLTNERNRVEKVETLVKSLKKDLSELRNELREREEALADLKSQLEHRESKREPSEIIGEIKLAAPEQLLALVEKLQKDVAERDDGIRELERTVEQLRHLTRHGDKEAYEAELNHYRAALEEDRVAVNEEIARLEGMRQEVEQLRHEMELHISRERVQIAREWVEINRIREQLRRDLAKREQPESAGKERPAKSKLTTKSEAIELTPSPPPDPPTHADLIARLRPGSKKGVEIK